MRGWLLDTNVVSELRKPNANPAVVGFINAQRGETLFVTDVTFAEIVYGIEQLGDPARRADLRSWLDNSLRPFFSGRVLGITEEVIIRWKTIVADGRKRGRTFGQPDLFIATIAALQDLAVVTRDVSEFVEAGVPTFDPWTSTFHHRDKNASVASPITLEKIVALL
ncbi:type II toxin-antitoxin system VapC family toxin [Bradyrhizobium sp. 147]|uniref:type II toxin-antitoxin system VapC family toxin n=1 Tax=Bradyrhizobium sp. 147 TaxID=2782623 RepID=UPI001FF9815A|nr:type II toxin-antitoxin system VapC family toxin [Bradyrhizobium sp. 147]MCK1678579.1 type II toxin-antitoxin system VapC family toxin [Bradyrhizobium sp. 147]